MEGRQGVIRGYYKRKQYYKMNTELENKDLTSNDAKPVLSEADFSEQKDGYFTTKKQPLIRFKIVKEIDPIFGGEYWDYRFEIFQRPYFWNLLGSKRWEMSVQTNGFTEGLSFSHYLLGCR